VWFNELFIFRVFEHRGLQRISGPLKEEATRGLRKLHNEELQSLYSTDIIVVIKSKRIGWAKHVARMGR
jgi:hypothetical protein